MLHVAAGGFSDDLMAAVEAGDHPVTTWTLDDLYAAWW